MRGPEEYITFSAVFDPPMQTRRISEAHTTGKNFIFPGLASAFWHVVDSERGATIIADGAFTKTLREHPEGFPLLYYHDQQAPIGGVPKLTQTADGLRFTAFTSNIPLGNATAELIKDDVLRAISIGFTSIKESFAPHPDFGQVRMIHELALFELSVCLYGADSRALIDLPANRQSNRFAEVSRIHEETLWDQEVAEMEISHMISEHNRMIRKGQFRS